MYIRFEREKVVKMHWVGRSRDNVETARFERDVERMGKGTEEVVRESERDEKGKKRERGRSMNS